MQSSAHSRTDTEPATLYGTDAVPILAPLSSSSPDDVVSTRHISRLATTDAFTQSLDFARQIPAADLIPSSFWAVSAHQALTARSLLAVARSGSLMIHTFARSTHVVVGAPTEDELRRLIEVVRGLAGKKSNPEVVPLRQWVLSRRGPRSMLRDVSAPAWHDIGHNYPAAVRRRLARTMGIVRPATTARLMVWHGAPGTGKTTALQALIREWIPWCEPHLVPDADAFFGDLEYLYDVLGHQPAPPGTGDDIPPARGGRSSLRRTRTITFAPTQRHGPARHSVACSTAPTASSVGARTPSSW
ncbi:MAG: DUF5925 domain-containing protein [Mycobacteriales bacterium]